MMFPEPIYVFAALSIALLVLTLMTLFLATRHDKVITLAGPLEEERAVTARIAEKRALVIEIDRELEERRKALASIADVKAEIDSLIRQRDALLVEWQQSAERRREVEALRLETEAAQIARVEAEAELATARASLDELRDRLARADEISRRLESLVAEREALETAIRALREEALGLQAELVTLRAAQDEIRAVREALAETQGRLSARQAELAECDIRLEAVKAALSATQAEFERLGPQLATAKQRLAEIMEETDLQRTKLTSLQTELEGLGSRKAELLDLQSKTADARAEFELVGPQLTTAKQRLAEVVEEADRQRAKLAFLQTELEALGLRKAELQDLEAKTADALAEFELVGPQLATAKQRLTDVTEEADLQRAKCTSLQAELEELAPRKAELQDLQIKASDARADLVQTRDKQKEVAEELDTAREALTALTARRAALEREIEKLRAVANGQTPAEEDPLKVLKDRPQVVTQLAGWLVQTDPSEPEALHRVAQRFSAFGLSYPSRTLHAFHTAMKVNDTTQMAVLAGISGTGKSQLPRQYAAGMGIGFLQVPVQPRWDSPQDLMGFYNYIEGRFRPTDMAQALFALDAQNNPDALPDRLLMVLLDEMNLARVEYYFSDFLSRLESRPAKGREGDQTLRKDAEIELEIPRVTQRIFPGYNLLFAGTMNEDESTQSLSDKVIDRANVLRFGAPQKVAHVQITGTAPEERALSRAQWERWCARGDRNDRRATESVDEMLALMQEFGKPFGHRLGRAILGYVHAYPQIEGVDRVPTALADQIEMRLLPKLRGVDVEEHGATFDQLRKMAEGLGDPDLSQAIGASVEAAQTTQQFVWRGVNRS